MKSRTLKFNREARDSYILILPLIVLLIVFILYPVLSNFMYSFTNWKGIGDMKIIGPDNYLTMLQDETFRISIKNTLLLVLFIPLGVMVPLFLSAILRTGLKGWSVFRAIIYLPNILGYVIIGLIFNIILRNNGPLNSMLNFFGLNMFAHDWLIKSDSALFSVGIVFVVWVKLGFGCIYFLASMSGINQSLYDAASIDGAGWWSTFWNVTVPSIRFSIEFFVVLSFIELFARAFPFIYTFTRGGPGFGTYTLEYGIYNAGFIGFKVGYASAWAGVLFIFCSIIAIAQIRLMRSNLND
ncbi:MAG: sugar ABC transporter permease [Spirochaetales bacterium]|nr:sugar ABC transporter permease [Spirochaetales bacterium]